MSQKLKVGDVFIISDVVIGDDVLSLNEKNRLGKVIFISKISKKVIGIVISKNTFVDIPIDINDVGFLDSVLYTGNQLLKRGDWGIVGNQLVSTKEEDLTYRLIGNSLWRLDSNLGVVPPNDIKRYNKQLIYGFVALYKLINKL